MDIESKTHTESHIKESSQIRDLVFGFGDGVNTSLGIIAGVGGAAVAADIVILSALVVMFTGAKAMAVQNYLAVKSQREILQSEIKREEFEIENVPERERQEIADIYMAIWIPRKPGGRISDANCASIPNINTNARL